MPINIPPSLEARRPDPPVPYSLWREFLWQVLATATIVLGAWYIWWRWTASLNVDALWFAIPLVVAETCGYIGLVLFYYNLWQTDDPPIRPPPATLSDCLTADDRQAETDRPVTVDVFFATYNEDPDLVRLGLRDAAAMAYPHAISVKVHVLDDGRRPAMAEVARQEGANYITRDTNEGYKAGNLRNAMEVTGGDFIVICDADTRPFPTFLERTLGYFRDPKVAWVQTPQWFYDLPEGRRLPDALGRWGGMAGRGIGKLCERIVGPVRIGQDPFANDPKVFYDAILRRRNRGNAAFCCGAGSIHRREAVMEIALRHFADAIDKSADAAVRETRRALGERDLDAAFTDAIRLQSALSVEMTPYKFHVSEDFYTSIELHRDRERGWRSIQHPFVESRMLSPLDLLSWNIQRFKYAGGTLDILFRDRPIFRPGLSLPQRLMYGATFWSYLAPLWTIVLLLAPIIFLFTGVKPVAAYSTDFFARLLPFLILNELAQIVGLWGMQAMRPRIWYMASFWINLKALVTVLRRQTIKFPVTPKVRSAGNHWRLVRMQMALIAVTTAAMTFGAYGFAQGWDGYTPGAMIANLFWGGFNALAMVPLILAAFWRPDADTELVTETEAETGAAL